LTIQNDLHKRKAAVFYNRKRAAKQRSRTSETLEAICLDFGKNLSLPNITTNDVYYKSQLNVYAFNIHILSTAKSVFYIYPETIGKKGSDDVCSMLHDFLWNFLDLRVGLLKFFATRAEGKIKTILYFAFCIMLFTMRGDWTTSKLLFPFVVIPIWNQTKIWD
jgi:hypothetical protein